MKKAVIFMGILALPLLSFSAPVKAITIVEKEMGFVSVNATAVKEIVPDTASIYFTVETAAIDSKSAVSKNNQISTELIESLKPIINSKKGDTIQTKNFVLRPNYKYEKNGKKTFVNYTASNTVYVKTKSLDNVSKLIDTAVSGGATGVSELSFLVENEKEYSGALAQEAISKAKILAQLTASTLNQKVSGVKSIRVSVYPPNSFNGRYDSMMKSSAGGVNSTPIEFGKIKLQANVDADFYVK